MEEKSISLSSHGLANINVQFNDFKFIINDHIFECSRFTAEFLSPVVAQMHLSDPTINTFKIMLDNPNKIDKSLISSFGDLLLGRQIEIHDSKSFSFFLKISNLLGNKELLNLLYGIDDKKSEQLDIKNAIEQLLYKIEFQMNCEKEISFIAENFIDIETIHSNDLLCLNSDVLKMIFFSNDLKIKNEDFLYDFIMKHSDSMHLLECIRFENMSQERMTEFLSYFSLEDLNYSMWERIRMRLLQTASINVRSKNFFPVNERDPFDGIIQSLYRECGGNPHTKGLVDVCASSSTSGGKSYQVLEKNWRERWRSENAIGSWWEIDFKERKVAVCAYSIKTKQYPPGSAHLKSWKLEGSNEHGVWTTIDMRKNTTELNGSGLSHTWQCKMTQPYRYLRITSIGYDHNMTNYLSFSGIEFFGILN
ncbi:hypothetical protein TRFO_04586 [Tritrichomonas foetus]|uniref:F5/8 type C domain-containing protein n=1 Tax=Tritrichomonas foetus TaxID=1144522 RepID=A0A1J4KE75_9EUKA|nr:hypothetical protein TRFO_04586 [Tritrichomonas foetus]|eukprot:OHT09491.1 hypothetical protein TRFO_04586 [Tritrichomonas foetus]